MKKFYVIMLLVFLSSCGTNNSQEPTAPEETEQNQVQEQPEDLSGQGQWDQSYEDMMAQEDEVASETAQDIEDEMDSMEESPENEVMTLDANYNNPNGEVDMKVNLELSQDDTIESIEVTATTYDVTDFNDAAQDLIGKDVAEAEEFYASGSSLTSDAFTKAIKNR